MEVIEAFLVVLAIGGLLCGVAWFFWRRRIQQSWRWRAPFCFLVAASVTPSAIKFFGDWSLVPAAFIAPIAFAGDSEWRYGFLFGMLPIILVATAILGTWTIIVKRRNRVAQQDSAPNTGRASAPPAAG